MDSLVQFLRVLALISGVLHALWEKSHIALYGGYEHLTRLPITVYATIGDVGYTIGAVLLVSLYRGNFSWTMSPSWSDIAGLAVLGGIIALMVEYKALALKRWFYLDTMPIIPMLRVGLTPILQMVILLPLSVWIAGMILRGIF